MLQRAVSSWIRDYGAIIGRVLSTTSRRIWEHDGGI